MVIVYPFKGLSYNRSDLKDLITEPYDKISKPMQKEYYDKNIHNFVRLNLPSSSDPYTSAKTTLKDWIENRVLIEDSDSYFYPYFQEFELNGKKWVRKGFFAIVKLEDFENEYIYPHEHTFPKPKEDRLNMIRATGTNLEPVFFLYNDPKFEIMQVIESGNMNLQFDITDDFGITHKLYRIKNPRISELFKAKKLVIADGHHRYETSLNYRAELISKNSMFEGANYIMAVLVNLYDEGLKIMSSHRVIKRLGIPEDKVLAKLKERFHLKPLTKDQALESQNYKIAYYSKNYLYSLIPKYDESDLNVNVLKRYILSEILNLSNLESQIVYERWEEEAINAVNSGEFEAAFLLSPTTPETVWNCAINKQPMPEKSTDFYPKLVSGLKLFRLASFSENPFIP